mmetsp:Transcript_8337/g.34934  ORF Transcript_8337/g.34934 Transcript_8337/m.34934 type:complete len:92 (-) Transcript_8337:315-590(-)|eukprot:CAMPEP_0114623040 /NCGR_PEP_ID=MMETSP0168-20121206/10042_1 /TAXON_ID=95228 ORGANISM="Vannella sp., Strain DIVA3 517/6/12" /NCGR_SAMPLE_ID=MMETSP0168 /ASSEMBLY_ACC=CAM_ASM_000044 /LENGTH=91 /DNA_ID=CAMNT_0001834263 /DNA_START=60 /DNA_END=335 /DNA_ORIENTATION=-
MSLATYSVDNANAPTPEEIQEAQGFYDEIEIEDMEFDEEKQTFYYPCPCGDRFQITVEELQDGEEIAHCPSCTLLLKIIYDEDDFLEEDSE